MKKTYEILATNRVADPKVSAELFGACLAADKGVANRLVPVRGGFDVVADDNRAIRFLKQ